MKRVKMLRKGLAAALAAAMLASGMTALAARPQLGDTLNSVKGLTGGTFATVEKDGKPENVAVKLDSSNKSLTWAFGDPGFTQDIVISAQVKAESAVTLTAGAGASYTVSQSDAWQKVQLLVQPKAKKWAAYLGDAASVPTGEGTLTSDAAVTQAVFTIADGTAYVDDLKVEQWDRKYDDADLDTPKFSTNFDSSSTGADIKDNIGGWKSNSTGDYAKVSNEQYHSAPNSVKINRSSWPEGVNNRYLHIIEGEKMKGDFVLNFWAYQPADAKAKLGLWFRVGPEDSGSSGPSVRLENGKIHFNNDNMPGYENAFTLGEWFKVTMAVSSTAKQYNIYINDKKLNDTPLTWEPDTSAGFGTMTMESEKTSDASETTIFIDDVSVAEVKTLKEKDEFSDDFENWSDPSIGIDTPPEVGRWRYGSRNRNKSSEGRDNNPANAEYAAKTADEVYQENQDNFQPDARGSKTVENIKDSVNNQSSGKLLEIKALKCSNGDQQVASDNSIRTEQIVARLRNQGDGISKDVKISFDMYAANYMFKVDGSGANVGARDLLRVALVDNYQYTNTNSTPGNGIEPVGLLTCRGGKVRLGGTSDTASNNTDGENDYSMNAWNHIVLNIDSNGKYSTTVNGVTKSPTSANDIGDMSNKSFTDLVFWIDMAPGGWFLIDNVKVQTKTEPVKVDVSKADRVEKLAQDVDSLLADPVSVAKLAPAEGKVGQVQVTANEEITAPIKVYAAVYTVGEEQTRQLTDVGVQTIQSMTEGAVQAVDFTQVACGDGDEVVIYVWDENLTPMCSAVQ